MEERKVEIFKNGSWLEIPFVELKCGDIFRMYESTGEPVVGVGGAVIFKAKSEASLIKGVYAVDAIPLDANLKPI